MNSPNNVVTCDSIINCILCYAFFGMRSVYGVINSNHEESQWILTNGLKCTRKSLNYSTY